MATVNETDGISACDRRHLNSIISSLGFDEAFSRLMKREPTEADLEKLLTPEELELVHFARAMRLDEHDISRAIQEARNDRSIAEEPPTDVERMTMTEVRDVIHQALESELTFNGGPITRLDQSIGRPGIWEWSLSIEHAPGAERMGALLSLRIDMSN